MTAFCFDQLSQGDYHRFSTTKITSKTMVEMDETPRGQQTFGEALAALQENLDQERQAERGHENAAVELIRVYRGRNAPEPSGPHYELWVQKHAACKRRSRFGDRAGRVALPR